MLNKRQSVVVLHYLTKERAQLWRGYVQTDKWRKKEACCCCCQNLSCFLLGYDSAISVRFMCAHLLKQRNVAKKSFSEINRMWDYKFYIKTIKFNTIVAILCYDQVVNKMFFSYFWFICFFIHAKCHLDYKHFFLLVMFLVSLHNNYEKVVNFEYGNFEYLTSKKCL